jgi:ribonuclease HI
VWTPPSGEFLKINTDGAFQAESRTGGWGFVIRDCDCSIRGSGAGLLTHVTSAAQAEAQACTEALHAAADWGMSQVHIESDSQNLVCALQSSDFDLAPEGVIYRDLRVFMRLHFSSVLITYVPCTCNKLAHALAALGMSRRANRQLWQEALPVELPVTSTIAESRI